MQKEYSTTEVADIIAIHPNTVRLYEKLEFITAPKRKENNYRIYTDLHIYQCKIIRCAFRSEVLQNGLRQKAVSIVRLCAELKLEKALISVFEYRNMINAEIDSCNVAIRSVEQLMNSQIKENIINYHRKDVIKILNVSIDSLRNWELNGLISVSKAKNGYKIYTNRDINKLFIIRTLRCANYSLTSILRLLTALDRKGKVSLDEELNYPQDNSNVVTACDHLKEMLVKTIDDINCLETLIKKLQKINPPL